jgi:crotonobetainyl-CoA:carnitine CoA-transferase CaiB-like acyl-CoA transferase
VTAPLTGYAVVDLSTGIAGAYCTKLLADGGADVVKVEPPEGDPLRRWSASGAEIPAGEDGALFAYLACSKRSVVGDPGPLLAEADAVVWSRGSPLTPAEIHSSHPHLTVTAITPFGLDGPWADRPATEFTLQAWSGAIVGSGRGLPDRAPVHVGGRVGEWAAGAFAAVGTMASRWRGGGEVVDVSILEAQILCLTFYPVTYHEQTGGAMYPGRFVRTPGVAAARDGLVGLGVGTGQHWLDFAAMVGHPEWAEDRSLLVDRTHLAPEIDAWVAERTVAEICELATAFRLPNAPIGNGANLPMFEHFRARGTFVPNPRDGFTQPGHPYRLQPARLRTPEPAPRLGEHDGARRTKADGPAGRDGLPFAGLRVLDMTAFWAGPSCTHVLALLGADVIHLESTSRLDGVRMVSRVPHTEDQWWERSPIFAALNTNKRSLTLDLAGERGRGLLRRLIPTCDVIVENYTPRVLDQLGLDYESVRTLHPGVIMVRLPGFGLDGPWRDLAAMAFIIEDATGLTWLTGYPDVNPFEPWTIADPNAGIHALSGMLLALEHRRQTGEGGLVEAAMSDAALAITAEQVVEHSAYGALLVRAGNRGPAADPQDLYRTADSDDSWVAIAAATDEQRAALRGATGAADLAAWCRGRGGDEIVELLWDVGVPVGKVIQPYEQPDLPQLRARRFFEELDHPASGRSRYSTVPLRFSSGPERFHRRHAPLLGEHNRELLGELGLSDAELDELEAEGVIGRAPAA